MTSGPDIWNVSYVLVIQNTVLVETKFKNISRFYNLLIKKLPLKF